MRPQQYFPRSGCGQLLYSPLLSTPTNRQFGSSSLSTCTWEVPSLPPIKESGRAENFEAAPKFPKALQLLQSMQNGEGGNMGTVAHLSYNRSSVKLVYGHIWVDCNSLLDAAFKRKRPNFSLICSSRRDFPRSGHPCEHISPFRKWWVISRPSHP